VRHLILVGAKAPVAFFAYPDKPSVLTPDGCQVHPLSTLAEDSIGALEALAEAVGARRTVRWSSRRSSRAATGALTPDTLAAALGALLPEGAIVSDESVTSGRGFFKGDRGRPAARLDEQHGRLDRPRPAPRHRRRGGMPRPQGRVPRGRRAAGMYTLQALWTQAREGLDVTTVVFANRTYAILRHELSGVRAGTPGPKAADMLDIGRPDLDWVSLARGMGVPASRAHHREEFNKQFAAGLAAPGPTSFEAVL